MEENYRRYPIGIQNFEQLRNRNCVYVDKTELVYRLANTDSGFSEPSAEVWEKLVGVHP